MARFVALALIAALALPAGAAEPDPVVTHSKAPARFDDVRDDLKMAIEARGLVIDFESRIQRMLERTGKDLGTPRVLYADAQTLQFCSAVLSRKMMEADPANVVMCPYTLTVYATAQQPATVHVAYRRPWRPDGSAASQAALREVEALLDSLAREAVGKK